MGVGAIRSMHCIGVLALKIPVSVSYGLGLVLFATVITALPAGELLAAFRRALAWAVSHRTLPHAPAGRKGPGPALSYRGRDGYAGPLPPGMGHATLRLGRQQRHRA
jgi:hypothetical protein